MTDDAPTQLAQVVDTSASVRATRSRKAKIAALAELLASVRADEVEIAVGLLIGEVRQGRIGVGFRTVFDIESSPSTEPTLTVTDLDEAVSEIQSLTGPGSQQARAGVLRQLLGRATVSEQDFVRRLLVGELRQGALEGLMIEAIAVASRIPAPMVRRATMLTGDVGSTGVIALTEGSDAIAAVGLELLRPIQPMLASTADDGSAALERTGLASLEWKLDGVRVQVHRLGDTVRIYTRNLNDVTDRMPEVVDVVSAVPAERIVLDGEVLGFDAEGHHHVFQDTMSRVGTEDDTAPGDVRLVPFFFDCQHHDGVDLVDEPLSRRRDLLEHVLEARHVIPAVRSDSVDAFDRVMQDALDHGHEGVLVKALDSRYEAGRRGKSWLKVKPVHTFELVVLAVDWGHGRRKGWLSNLHLGARDEATGELVMLGKTFKGMTDEMLAWQTERFLELEQSRSGITVTVRPELVVEVAVDGVQTSTRYPGGIALRFARVKRYRPDRSVTDIDTVESLRRLQRS